MQLFLTISHCSYQYRRINCIPYNGCRVQKLFLWVWLSFLASSGKVFKLLPVFQHFRQLLGTLLYLSDKYLGVKLLASQVPTLTF